MINPSEAHDRLFLASYLGAVAHYMRDGLHGSDDFILHQDTVRVVKMVSPATLQTDLALPVLLAKKLLLGSLQKREEFSEPPLKSSHELFQEALITFIDKTQLDVTHPVAGLYTDVLETAFENKPTSTLAHRLLSFTPTMSRASDFLADRLTEALSANTPDGRTVLFEIAPTPQILEPMGLSAAAHAQIAFQYGALATFYLTAEHGVDFCRAVRALRSFAVVGLNTPDKTDRDNLYGLTRQADLHLMRRYVSSETSLPLSERAEGLRLLVELNDSVLSPAAARESREIFLSGAKSFDEGVALLGLASSCLAAYPYQSIFYRNLVGLAHDFVTYANLDAAMSALNAAALYRGPKGPSEALALRNVISNPLHAAPAAFRARQRVLSVQQFNDLAFIEGFLPEQEKNKKVPQIMSWPMQRL